MGRGTYWSIPNTLRWGDRSTMLLWWSCWNQYTVMGSRKVILTLLGQPCLQGRNQKFPSLYSFGSLNEWVHFSKKAIIKKVHWQEIALLRVIVHWLMRTPCEWHLVSVHFPKEEHGSFGPAVMRGFLGGLGQIVRIKLTMYHDQLLANHVFEMSDCTLVTWQAHAMSLAFVHYFWKNRECDTDKEKFHPNEFRGHCLQIMVKMWLKAGNLQSHTIPLGLVASLCAGKRSWGKIFQYNSNWVMVPKDGELCLAIEWLHIGCLNTGLWSLLANHFHNITHSVKLDGLCRCHFRMHLIMITACKSCEGNESLKNELSTALKTAWNDIFRSWLDTGGHKNSWWGKIMWKAFVPLKSCEACWSLDCMEQVSDCALVACLCTEESLHGMQFNSALG